MFQKILTKTQDNRNRSEEHTSELQSQSNLVCRLLLEKKKYVNFIDFAILATGAQCHDAHPHTHRSPRGYISREQGSATQIDARSELNSLRIQFSDQVA